MAKPNIILTGFMGTGKTSVGRRLAARLQYDFIDTDDLIEERSGKTVVEIFQVDGEAVFREMEAAMARELANREGLVIATGGRLMLDRDNAALLRRNGRVFCLSAGTTEIMVRVAADPGRHRPLLDADAPRQRIETLLRRREKGYQRFPQVDTSGKTVAQVTEELLDILREDPQFPELR